MSLPKFQKKSFTLIELLFVIVIIGILIAVSLPNFRKTFDNLRLNSFVAELQSFMNYLRERAIVEGAIIYLNIDNNNRQLWAQIKSTQNRLKTLPMPEGTVLEIDKNQILFYPDGQIDSFTLTVTNPNGQKIILTTKGVFGGVKVLTQE